MANQTLTAHMIVSPIIPYRDEYSPDLVDQAEFLGRAEKIMHKTRGPGDFPAVILYRTGDSLAASYPGHIGRSGE